jgi:hypothetical protein
MTWDRFAIVEGHYLYCTLWHEGQFSDLYKRLCRIGEYFTPGAMWSESRILENEDGEHDATLEVYFGLLEKHGHTNNEDYQRWTNS